MWRRNEGDKRSRDRMLKRHGFESESSRPEFRHDRNVLIEIKRTRKKRIEIFSANQTEVASRSLFVCWPGKPEFYPGQ